MIIERIFDLATEDGLKEAEAFKERLERQFYTVKVTTYGLNTIKVKGE